MMPFRTKLCYMVAGFDVSLALLGVCMHKLEGFAFALLAGIMTYYGDKIYEIENQKEPKQ